MFNFFGSKKRKIASDLDTLLQEQGFPGASGGPNLKLFDLKAEDLSGLKSLGTSEKILEKVVEHLANLMSADTEFKKLLESNPTGAQNEVVGLVKTIQKMTGGVVRGLPYALAPRVLTQAREVARLRGVDPNKAFREEYSKKYELAQKPGASSKDKHDPATALTADDMSPQDLALFGLTKDELTYDMTIKQLEDALHHFMGFQVDQRGETKKFKNEGTSKMPDDVKAEFIYKLMAILRNIKIMADMDDQVPYNLKSYELRELGETLSETEKLAKNWLKKDEKVENLQYVDLKTTYGYAGQVARSIKKLRDYILQDSIQNAMKAVPDLDLGAGVDKLEAFMAKDRSLDMQLFADTVKDIDAEISKLNLDPKEQKYIYEIFDSQDMIAKDPETAYKEALEELKTFKKYYLEILHSKDPKVMKKKFDEVLRDYRTWDAPSDFKTPASVKEVDKMPPMTEILHTFYLPDDLKKLATDTVRTINQSLAQVPVKDRASGGMVYGGYTLQTLDDKFHDVSDKIKSYLDGVSNKDIREGGYKDLARLNDAFAKSMEGVKGGSVVKTAAEMAPEDDIESKKRVLNGIYVTLRDKVSALKSIIERHKKGELDTLYKKAEDFYNYFHDLRSLYKEQLNIPAIDKLKFMIKEVIKDFRTFLKSSKAKTIWDGHWLDKEQGKEEVKGPVIEEKTDDEGKTVKGYFSLFDQGIDSNIVGIMDFILDSPFFDFLDKKMTSMSNPGMPRVTGPTYSEAEKILEKLEDLGSAMDKVEPNSVFRKLQDKLLKNVSILNKAQADGEGKPIRLPGKPVGDFEVEQEQEKKLKKQQSKSAPPAAAPTAPAATKTASIGKVAYLPMATYIRKMAHSMLTGAEAPALDLKHRYQQTQVSKKQPAWERFQKRDKPGGLTTTVPGFFMEPDSVDEFVDALENDHFDFMKSMTEGDDQGLPEERRSQYDPGLDKIVAKTLLKGSQNLREHILTNKTHMVKDMRNKISRILKEYAGLDAQAKKTARELEDLNTVHRYKERLEALAKFLNAPEEEVKNILSEDEDLLNFYEKTILGKPGDKKKGIRQQVMRETREKKVYDERAVLKKKLIKYLEKYTPHEEKKNLEQKKADVLKRIQGLQKELKGYQDSGKDYEKMNEEITTLKTDIDKMKQEASQKGLKYEEIPGYSDAAEKLTTMMEDVKGYNSVKLGLESANVDLKNLGRPAEDVSNEEYQKFVDYFHKSLSNPELISKAINDVNLEQISRMQFEKYLKGQEDMLSQDIYKKFFDVDSWKLEKDRSEKNLGYSLAQLENDKKALDTIKSETTSLEDGAEKDQILEDINNLQTVVENGTKNTKLLENYLKFLDKEMTKYEGFMAARAPGIEKEFKRLMETPVFDQPHFSSNPKALQHPVIKNLGLDKIRTPDELSMKMKDITEVSRMFSDNADALDAYLRDLDTYRRRLHTAPIPREKYKELYPKVMDRYKKTELMMHQLRKNYVDFNKYTSDLMNTILGANGYKSLEEFAQSKNLPVPVKSENLTTPPQTAPVNKQAGTGEPDAEREDPVNLIKSHPGYEEKIPEERVMDWDIIEALFERDQDSLKGFKDVFQKGGVDLADKKLLRQLNRKTTVLADRIDKLGKLKDLKVTIDGKPVKVSEVGKEFNKLLEEYTAKKNELTQRQNSALMKKSDIRFQLNELLNLIGLDADEILNEANNVAASRKEHDPEGKVDMTQILDEVIEEKDPESKEFKGFTEKELVSIENQFYRDMFWALMRKWGDKIGERVVFGEKTKPEFSMIYDTFKNLTGVKSNPILSKVIRIAQESRRMLKELKKKLRDMEQAYKGTKQDVTQTTEYKDTLNRVNHLKKLIAQKKTMNKIIATEVDAEFKMNVFEKIKGMTKDPNLIEMIDNKIDSYKKQAEALAEDKARELEEEGKALAGDINAIKEERVDVPTEKVPTPEPQAPKVAYDKNHRDFNMNVLYGPHMQKTMTDMLAEILG